MGVPFLAQFNVFNKRRRLKRAAQFKMSVSGAV
jgi:hypothetical protein